MMWVRRSNQRGHFDHGWLKTWHTFSFGQYQDPQFIGFESLRVINEDFISPNQGFGEHGHQDMEILTWVLEGRLSHADSLGNRDSIVPLQAQIMSAGTGIRHSEFNSSLEARVHLLQVWIIPSHQGLHPRYDQVQLSPTQVANRWATLASCNPVEGALTIFQDVDISVARLDLGMKLDVSIRPGRSAWLQVARGEVRIGGEHLRTGDAIAEEEVGTLEMYSLEMGSEVLWFDLAKRP